MSKQPDLSAGDLAKAVEYGLLRSLNDAAFCMTGTMSTTRPKIAEIISALGGWNHGQVRRDTDFLIVPDGTFRKGSKHKVASQYGTKVITESQFCEMIFPTVEELLGDSNDSAGRTT